MRIIAKIFVDSIFLVLNYLNIVNCFEPITIGVTAGVGVVGISYLKSFTYCRYYECCDEHNIPGDIDGLIKNLKQSLYGQHIILENIKPALLAHFNKNNTSRKPLVFSFHGTPGTGKNFVSDQIAKALYKHGLQSNYVHKYLGRADFPRADMITTYTERINKEVRDSLRACPRSLFIFDEVDKMPGGIFDSLASLVDYNNYVDGFNNAQAIFIFLSNTAGVHISDTLGKLIKGGTLREDVKLGHFENLLKSAAYNLDGGFKYTSLIKAHVIDHYLPFLPLEKRHVLQCIDAEFRRWGHSPSQLIIDEIASTSIIYEQQHGLFATSGCKTLEKKVAVAVMSARRQ